MSILFSENFEKINDFLEIFSWINSASKLSHSLLILLFFENVKLKFKCSLSSSNELLKSSSAKQKNINFYFDNAYKIKK